MFLRAGADSTDPLTSSYFYALVKILSRTASRN